VSTISYDPQRRFLKAIETKLNGETVQNLSYDRYGNGQVKELLNTRGAQTDRFSYEYDLVGRLAQTKQVSSVQPDDVDKSYGYDVHGNLNNFAGRIITFPDATPHLPSAVGSTAYTHVNGNLTSRTGADVPGSSQVFTYTPFNLPKTITTGTINPRLTQLDYTADEQRVVRRDPDRTHHFAGDLYERVSSPSGATLEEHFRLPAGATIVAEIIRTPAGDQTLYFHPDALGTPETLTDASGTVTHQSFDPFGARPDGSATLATRIGYTGQHQDDDLALIDMGGRVYDPLAGRFTTADPVLQAPYSSQGQNRYAYVFNDPINLTDPSGFSADGVGAGGGAFAGELLIGGLARASISSGALTGAGIGGGVAGGAANVVGTLLANPFVGSSGGTYGAAAPSGAQNSNPVKPGGMNAVGQGRPPGAAAVQERGLPRYEGGAPGVPSGEGGNGGAGGLAPNAAGRFDPGSYVDYDRLSPTARRLLRPIFDRFGYDVARIRIRFDAEVSTADTNGDLIRINPDLWSNPKWNNYKRMQLLTHEVTHSVQFQNLGSGAMRWRVGVERVTHVFGDVYDVPNRLADTPLAGINVVDPRFTLEGIAARMEDFARTVPP
jgi:RHS repeat-associated protein